MNAPFKPITATFLDGIACDIPSNNWTPAIWRREFARYQADGVTDAVIIRVGWGDSAMYDSEVMKTTLVPELDMVKLFLDLGAEYGVRIHMGLYDTFSRLVKADWRGEVAVNLDLIDELQGRYGNHPAFQGWYMSHEGPIPRNQARIPVWRALCEKIRSFDTRRPILVSPCYDGPKHNPENPLPPKVHREQLEDTLIRMEGLIDIYAPMDGHVHFRDLEEYMAGTAELLAAYGARHWSNLETFDRDMPWRFPPIEFAKLVYKLELAQKYVERIMSFEMPHFLSPDSMFPSAGELYRRYHAWLREKTARP